MTKPKVNSDSQRELDKVQTQFDDFNNQVQELTLDRMNQAPKQDVEPQTKLSQSEIQKSKDIYLKPTRSIGSKEPFNEKWREQYNFAKEYVQFIAENKEILGEDIEIWTKPFPGLPAEFWRVPVNKPVWGPRYLAENIRDRKYHRLTMDNRPTSSDGNMTYYGNLIVDNTIQRLDAYPVSTRRSVFTGATSF